MNRNEVLFKACKILDTNSINYWICNGTLLGIIRENRILPWDHDIDIAVWENEISKSKVLYKKGQYHVRTKMPSFNSKKSKHIVNFENKYNCKINDLKCVSKETNIPIDILKKVINKGMGAYYSSGSRPNQTPHSWICSFSISFIKTKSV